MPKSFRELEVWNIAIDLAALIYGFTADFPKQEIYGLSSQMRRAAVSIPGNIAEGSARGTRRDFRQFVKQAEGSNAELQTQLIIAMRLQFGDLQKAKAAEALALQIGRMLTGLSTYLAREIQANRSSPPTSNEQPTTFMLNIRPATPADIPEILAFIRELAEYEHEPESAQATPDDLLRDGFGPTPRFHALIAEWSESAPSASVFQPQPTTCNLQPAFPPASPSTSTTTPPGAATRASFWKTSSSAPSSVAAASARHSSPLSPPSPPPRAAPGSSGPSSTGTRPSHRTSPLPQAPIPLRVDHHAPYRPTPRRVTGKQPEIRAEKKCSLYFRRQC